MKRRRKCQGCSHDNHNHDVTTMTMTRQGQGHNNDCNHNMTLMIQGWGDVNEEEEMPMMWSQQLQETHMGDLYPLWRWDGYLTRTGYPYPYYVCPTQWPRCHNASHDTMILMRMTMTSSLQSPLETLLMSAARQFIVNTLSQSRGVTTSFVMATTGSRIHFPSPTRSRATVRADTLLHASVMMQSSLQEISI